MFENTRFFATLSNRSGINGSWTCSVTVSALRARKSPQKRGEPSFFSAIVDGDDQGEIERRKTPISNIKSSCSFAIFDLASDNL